MWRQDELNRINQTTSGAEKKAALCMLLEQEAHLIASIGRHKIVANEKGKESGIRNFLEAVRKQRTVHVMYIYMYIAFVLRHVDVHLQSRTCTLYNIKPS